MKQNIPSFIGIILSIVLIIVLNKPLGKAPALGPFLSPSNGFLQNRESQLDLSDRKLPDGLLSDSATVVFDSLLIPHIYAENLNDAYRIQGYLLARYRFWQMDFISRVASGRLSEVVGERAIEYDKKQRRKGLARGAKLTEEAWKKYPISYGYLEAFAEGVNAYISTWTPSDLPIEFKLLGYEAEEWTPYKSALFFKHMSDVLCSKEKDFEMTNARAILGEAVFNDLYPERDPESPPVIPSLSSLLPDQETEDRDSVANIGGLQRPFERKASGLGSNNWAVHPTRSQSGHPLLANDPHLPLTLPSIWYLVHIHTPQSNAMGVCFPGIPGIILGFNENISWGVTNVGQDVLDWLVVEWDEKSSTYQWGEETKRVEWVEEVIQVKGKTAVVDSVPWTEYGPIWKINTMDGPKDAIMRWLALEVPQSDEMSAFIGVNQAKNWQEFQNAIRKYNSPPQNFVFASKSGDIGLQVQGRFPNRTSRYGRFIETAESTKTWSSFIPDNEVPSMKNPTQGFLASANQVSTDENYPYYYINADFRPSRARTINNKLRELTKASPKDMMALQLNNYDAASHNLVTIAAPMIDLREPAVNQLLEWDGFYHADCQICPLAELWKEDLQALIYDELVDADNKDIEYPSPWQTARLIRDQPSHIIMDHKGTPEKDTAASLVNQALETALAKYNEIEDPRWSNYRKVRITHIVSDLKPFGHYDLPVGGTAAAPNAQQDTKGPSWRFVDELDDKLEAWGVYPGGQNGNPGSHYYDNLLPKWQTGEYYRLSLSHSPDEIESPLFIMTTTTSHE